MNPRQRIVGGCYPLTNLRVLHSARDPGAGSDCYRGRVTGTSRVLTPGCYPYFKHKLIRDSFSYEQLAPKKASSLNYKGKYISTIIFIF